MVPARGINDFNAVDGGNGLDAIRTKLCTNLDRKGRAGTGHQPRRQIASLADNIDNMRIGVGIGPGFSLWFSIFAGSIAGLDQLAILAFFGDFQELGFKLVEQLEARLDLMRAIEAIDAERVAKIAQL